MTGMTHDGAQITAGVDTHGLTHHAAVIDTVGWRLTDREFPAAIRGYRDLLEWTRSHGALVTVGVEGTGAHGAELARVLTAAGVAVVMQAGADASGPACSAAHEGRHVRRRAAGSRSARRRAPVSTPAPARARARAYLSRERGRRRGGSGPAASAWSSAYRIVSTHWA